MRSSQVKELSSHHGQVAVVNLVAGIQVASCALDHAEEKWAKSIRCSLLPPFEAGRLTFNSRVFVAAMLQSGHDPRHRELSQTLHSEA
eukprot:3735528-Amphidinium_carterae.1